MDRIEASVGSGIGVRTVICGTIGSERAREAAVDVGINGDTGGDGVVGTSAAV